MLTNSSRKRKSSNDHPASNQEHGPRRSQRLRLKAAGNDQHGALPSSSQPSPSPPQLLSGAPSNRSNVLELRRSRNEGVKRPSPPHLGEKQEKKVFTFFSFPGELRNMIYEYSLHYPDSRQLYAPYYRRCDRDDNAAGLTTWMPRLRAPTILLLNKRITNECHAILKSTTLVIDRLPPPRSLRHRSGMDSCPYIDHDGYPQLSQFMRLAEFISPRTLQSIPQIEINVGLCEGPLGSGWAWMPVLDELLSILTQRNACTKLRLLIRMCNTADHPIVAHSDRDYQFHMIKKFKKFASVNPNVFARRKVRLDVWKIEGQKATHVSARSFPEPVLVLEDGEVYELDRPQKELISAPRMYPDREMFPGSVMEFVKAAPPPFYSNDDSD